MFETLIKDFDESIKALRTFVEEIRPLLENKQHECQKDFEPFILAGLRNEMLEDLSKNDNKDNLDKLNKSIDNLLIEKFGKIVDVEYLPLRRQKKMEKIA